MNTDSGCNWLTVAGYWVVIFLGRGLFLFAGRFQWFGFG
jgi:hypothetical protein